MKSLAIIGASYLQRPLVYKAKEMGLRTICFAWAENATCEDVCDVFYPISIVEKEEILSICKQECIDGICTIASDVAAPTVAYVANKMDLVGNDYCAAVNANNKYAMRKAFMAADIPCPNNLCVYDASDKTINDISQKLSLPLIVKPTDRSGSLGVTKVELWDNLKCAIKRAIELSFNREAIIEEFIEGREVSVEYISYNGKHYPLQITDKVTTEAPHFVELEHHQPSTLSKDMFQKIYNITGRALNALGLTNGASHSEYKITKEGRIFVMEIGGRMGGDFIGSDLVRLSTGYDFVKGVIEVSLGRFNVPNKIFDKYSGVYFLCEETKELLPILNYADENPEIVAHEITDTQLRTIRCSADRSGYFLYQSEHKLTKDELLQRTVRSMPRNGSSSVGELS